MTPDEIVYWSRNEHKITEFFKENRIDFIKETRRTKLVSDLPTTLTAEVFRRGVPFSKVGYHDLLSEYSETSQAEAFLCEIGCDLKPTELLHCIKSKYIANETAFTPQQIKWLAREQNKRELGDFLTFDRPHYFPILGQSGTIAGFCKIEWDESRSFADNPKNRWKCRFISLNDEKNAFNEYWRKRAIIKGNSHLVLLRETSG